MTNIDKILNEAKSLLLKGKLNEAIIVFKKVLEIDSTQYKVQNNIGAILLKLNKLNEAEQNFQKTINLNPDFEIAYYNLGIVQEKNGKFNEAKKSFEKAIKLNPKYVDAYNNLGTLFLKIKNFYDAENCFKNVIKYKPNFSEAYYNLGLAQSKQNKKDFAEINYRKALELNSEFKDAQNNLNKLHKENKLLIKISETQKFNKNIENFKINKGLLKNPYIFKKEVENELITELYKIKTEELNKTKDIRYGNGVCSDYQLFQNNSTKLKEVEKNLIEIMQTAVNSDVFIFDSFFNILRKGSGLTSHNHINDFDKNENLINKKYSLTYYLSVGDQKCSEPGILKIYDPYLEILPSPGTIVIFPANRQHSVAYNGKTDRVMIGINFYST